jgi:hypothetical protein
MIENRASLPYRGGAATKKVLRKRVPLGANRWGYQTSSLRVGGTRCTLF